MTKSLGAQSLQLPKIGAGVGFQGPTGIFIKVGYRGNLVVSGYTGCRSPRAKK